MSSEPFQGLPKKKRRNKIKKKRKMKRMLFVAKLQELCLAVGRRLKRLSLPKLRGMWQVCGRVERSSI